MKRLKIDLERSFKILYIYRITHTRTVNSLNNRMSHATHINESCHTHECVMSHRSMWTIIQDPEFLFDKHFESHLLGNKLSHAHTDAHTRRGSGTLHRRQKELRNSLELNIFIFKYTGTQILRRSKYPIEISEMFFLASFIKIGLVRTTESTIFIWKSLTWKSLNRTIANYCISLKLVQDMNVRISQCE